MIAVGIVLIALENGAGFVRYGEDGEERVAVLELAVGTATVVELCHRCSATVIASDEFVVIGGAPDVLVFESFATSGERVLLTNPPIRVVIVCRAVKTSRVGYYFAHPTVLTVIGRGGDD